MCSGKILTCVNKLSSVWWGQLSGKNSHMYKRAPKFKFATQSGALWALLLVSYIMQRDQLSLEKFSENVNELTSGNLA